MILYPAIDLKGGHCVRLYQGDMNMTTVFNNSPSTQALMFQKEGAEWIHVVDLDGAFAGQPANVDAIRSIRQATNANIQLGGGIRSLETIESWLNEGISRVILGTVAVKNPQLVKDACKKFPGKIAVGIDSKEGFVATEGWAEKSDISSLQLAKMFEDAGVAAIIYTDISRDGAMKGPNIEETKNLARDIDIPVILSGGVSKLEDLKNVKAECPYLNGVISGRAIYEKAFTVKQGIEALR
jgi:phosphoribosylformimino-5-aminoimidazole carboxamide ribotide isomerase